MSSRGKPPPPMDREALHFRQAWITMANVWLRNLTGKDDYRPPVDLDGGVHPATGRRHTPVWPRVLDDAKATGLDPIDLMAHMWATWDDPKLMPRPYAVYDPHVVQGLRERQDRAKNDAQQDLRRQSIVLFAAIKRCSFRYPDANTSRRAALSDPSVGVSPLFRYASARFYGLDELAKVWVHDAAMQFRLAPDAYMQHWKAVLPPALVNDLMSCR